MGREARSDRSLQLRVPGNSISLRGADLTFGFSRLAPSDGTGGQIVIASGGTGATAGIDLFEPDEFALIQIDGVFQGSFDCTGAGNFTQQLDFVVALSDVDCSFIHTLPVAPSDLDAFLLDGSIDVQFFTAAINRAFAWHNGFGRVTLSYTASDAGPGNGVPSPPTLPLLLAGLALLAASTLRCRAGASWRAMPGRRGRIDRPMMRSGCRTRPTRPHERTA